MYIYSYIFMYIYSYCETVYIDICKRGKIEIEMKLYELFF